jgi:muramoyltetrapeptide carboxypeptidase
MDDARFSSASAEKRAEDLMDAFRDDDVRAIISTIGGLTSNQLLDKLDYEAIQANPTIFCGYSDMTNLHVALQYQANMVSFYGPAVITQFGEWPQPHSYTAEEFLGATQSTDPRVIEASEEWTDDKDNMDYVEGTDTGYHRDYQDNPGYQWLHHGEATGQLLGGCITSLMNLRGTTYWPDMKDSILVLETPEGANYWEGEDLGRVQSYLTNLRLDGTFDEANGVVFGRGFGYTDEEQEQLKAMVEEATDDYDMPVLYGADIGHTDPMTTVPLGAQASLISKKDEFKVHPGVTE